MSWVRTPCGGRVFDQINSTGGRSSIHFDPCHAAAVDAARTPYRCDHSQAAIARSRKVSR